MSTLVINEMKATDFKKQYKKELSKKLQPELIQVSQSSDFTSQSKIVQLFPSLSEDVLILKSRNNILGYVIKSIKLLEAEELKKLLNFAEGHLNFVSKINSKEVSFTFKVLPEKTVTEEIYNSFLEVRTLREKMDKTKEIANNEIIEMLGSITKENIEEAKKLASESAYKPIINNLYSEYRKKFEAFCNTYKFNCYDYILKMEA